MEIPDYTLLVAVDAKHLKQLAMTWPTWRRHKPSLLDREMVAVFDREQLSSNDVYAVVDHPRLRTTYWPPLSVTYEGGDDKWTNSQRYKMLAAFVYASRHVTTPYYLKLDTDVVATGMDDWIDPQWFEDWPAIVSAPWSFTKPPDQMLKLDGWVEDCKDKLGALASQPALNLVPNPGSERLGHKRIISFCAFFNTGFSKQCADWAEQTCGKGKLPVPSQDGFLFYAAKRLQLGIIRPQMKARGFAHWSTDSNVRRAAEEAMQ